MNRNFLPGDIVTLKDGSILMTVEYYVNFDNLQSRGENPAEPIIVCKWHGDKKENEILSLSENQLKLVYRQKRSS